MEREGLRRLRQDGAQVLSWDPHGSPIEDLLQQEVQR
jgi:hypothetical protein